MNEIYILDVKINDFSIENVINQIERRIQENQKFYVTTPNPEIVLKTVTNPEYLNILNQGYINIPDGFGLKIGALIFGRLLKHRVTGVDLTYQVLKLAEQKNYSVLFIGGHPEVNQIAEQKIKEKYPNLKINFIFGHDFNDRGESSDPDLLNKINYLNPDLIFNCYGAPKQEFWINENLEKISSLKAAFGVGGTLEFIAGKINRAPKIFRIAGLEWLWRLIQEPKRIKRIFNAVVIFPLKCIVWRFKH